MLNRRDFLVTSAKVTSAVAGAAISAHAADTAAPWYRRVCRWGQTNITEHDPARYDIPWWREYWKRTHVQGVIINAGGIVAYYPSKFPLHHRAEFLGDRDLYGELATAAHEDGLAVLARMDSNRTAEDFYRAHPDWFARDAAGQPYRAERQVSHLHQQPLLRRIHPGRSARRSSSARIPKASPTTVGAALAATASATATTARASSGDSRASRCRARKIGTTRSTASGSTGTTSAGWRSGTLYNRVTKGAGGPNCLWIGMNSGSISSQSRSFRDFQEICRRAEFMLLDHQARTDASGFQQNGDTGKLVHGLLGWDKLMPESMALYQAGRPTFRLAAKPAAESRMWMIAGFAGGIQPWWHHIGAYHEDRRAYHTAEPVFRWHQEHEQYLINRQPDRGRRRGLVAAEYGFLRPRRCRRTRWTRPIADSRRRCCAARIPYLPVNADHIERDAAALAVLVLPNVGALSDAQCAAIRRFVERGGGLIATGATSLYNEWGDAVRISPWPIFSARMRPRPDFGGSRWRALRSTPTCASREASATRCCAASRTPTSCRSAARWKPCAPTPAPPSP